MSDLYFYSHLINFDDIHNKLMLIDAADEERQELLKILESTIHHTVIDILLTELPDEHKTVFMAHLSDNNHDKIWALITEHVDNPEDKITQTYSRLKEDVLTDILESLTL